MRKDNFIIKTLKIRSHVGAQSHNKPYVKINFVTTKTRFCTERQSLWYKVTRSLMPLWGIPTGYPSWI